jgi:hypothetical protein
MARQRRLSQAWEQLRYHPEQARLWSSIARFRIVAAGRRSGKTELAIRYLVIAACLFSAADDGWFVLAAPTRDQARGIFWKKLLRLVPKSAIARVYEGRLEVLLKTGATISVVGMDKPYRIEGRPLDGIVLDEFGNMRATVWEENVQPALGTPGRPPGWAWLIGVPEGRNHFFELYDRASGTLLDYEAFHWISADIADPSVIASAKATMDPVVYSQEWEASFVNFTGLAYYNFQRTVHARTPVKYLPGLPIMACFDFNYAPGTATIFQEQPRATYPDRIDLQDDVLVGLGEVYIPRNSTSEIVSRRVLKDWGHHEGDVLLYGDATGGAKGSAKVRGSDWDLVKGVLRPHFGRRLKSRVPKANPYERPRINAVNSRLMTADGNVGMLLDPHMEHTIRDFEGVTLVEGGSGELDKDANPKLTHLTDGLGYCVWKRHPLGGALMEASYN